MVRLLTVIGHGVNLLPHFIKHYKRYVDEINIAIYKTDLYPTLEEDINEIIKDHDNVKIVKVIEDRVFDWEKVTALYNFIKIKHSYLDGELTWNQPNQGIKERCRPVQYFCA